MSPPITYRALSKKHAQPAAQLMRMSFEATYPNFEQLHTTAGDLAFMRDQLMMRRQVDGAFDGADLIGFIAHGAGEVDQLYIHPNRLRCGIGTGLLNRAKTAHNRLRLWTFAQNTGARAFYASHGFVQINATDDNNEHGAPDVQLEWVRLA